MTQVVTVHTDFTDLNQMAQGLVGRVNETHVILPGPDAVDVGDWVQFAVTLYDGTPGFAGVGRCVTVVDNGEDRLSHQRFDVVIDSLQFDSRGQQIFEHILMLNGVAVAPAEGEGDYAQADGAYQDAGEEAAAFEDVSGDFGAQSVPAPVDEAEAEVEAYAAADHYAEAQDVGSFADSVAEEDEDATQIGSREDFDAALARSMEPEVAEEMEDGMPTAPPPQAITATPPAQAATQPPPAAAADEMPVYRSEQPRPAINGSNGVHSAPSRSVPPPVHGASFNYKGGLPFPAVPPRPELPPTRRVTPAPRPADSAEHHH